MCAPDAARGLYIGGHSYSFNIQKTGLLKPIFDLRIAAFAVVAFSLVCLTDNPPSGKVYAVDLDFVSIEDGDGTTTGGDDDEDGDGTTTGGDDDEDGDGTTTGGDDEPQSNRAEICDDGIDNDNDGQTDGEDSECDNSADQTGKDTLGDTSPVNPSPTRPDDTLTANRPGSDVTPENPNVSTVFVSIPLGASDFASQHFSPMTLQITRGTTVVWTNNDDIVHTLSAEFPPMFFGSEPLLGPGGNFQDTFYTSGMYRYSCSIHPHMTSATIQVN